MSKYYKLVEIDNLKEVQEKLLSILPKDYLEHRNFINLNDNLSFVNIPELKQALDKFGISEYAKIVFSYNIMPANSKIPVHSDSASFRYSLNIPLTDCTNSCVRFYKLKPNTKGLLFVDPSDREKTVVDFVGYQSSNCVEVERAYINQPYILDTTIPHDVLCEDTTTTRVTFLCRLIPDADEHVQQFTGLRDNNIYLE